MNEALNDVLNWFTTNNLILNSNKIKCMTNTKPLGTNLTLNNGIISIVDLTVFLGITLDSIL